MARKWIREASGKTLTDAILSSRGITDRKKFLYGKLSDLYDASHFKDGDKAVEILREAIEKGHKIVIVPDYDTDGICGGAVALLMLRELGAKVDYYTNNRFTQGYGLGISSLDDIMKMHPDVKLIYTVDNGISAHEAAEYAKNTLGLQLVITDHHEAGETLPMADAIVDPKRRDATYPFDGICGAVVSWKVLRELYPNKKDANKYLDILSISTVGDVVPLLDENRIIVKEGLKLLKDDTRLSLRILREMTNTTDISSHFTLGFIYSPIFNAAGRLTGEVRDVIDVIVSEDEEFIREKLTKLINLNEERKALTTTQVEKAEDLLEKKGVNEVIVLYDPDFNEGIIGLIAGRLKEKYNRPTVVFTDSENGSLKASARSIEEFDMKKNLDKIADIILGYGGHAMAAGLSIEPDKLSEFEDKMIAIAKDILKPEDFIKKYRYVHTVKEDEIGMDMIDELTLLEPYGAGFPKPLIKLDSFNVRRCFVMGKEKIHIKLAGEKVSLIGWRMAEDYETKGSPLRITALGYPELNIYNNNVNIQFVINEDNFMGTP